MQPSVTYLGHRMDKHPLKVQAVKDAPSPIMLAPLYKLLQEEVHWRWTDID